MRCTGRASSAVRSHTIGQLRLCLHPVEVDCACAFGAQNTWLLSRLSRGAAFGIPKRAASALARFQVQVGSGIVLGISLMCVLTTHVGALGHGTIQGGRWWFFLLAIYLEAIVAVCCLLGILFGDPGVVKRTPENCLPLPEMVAERLHRGESLEGLDNLQHEQLGSYCVRCCVWRRNPGKLARSYLPADCDASVCEQGPHHCSTCARCVNHFDQCAQPRSLLPPPPLSPPRST